jgi:hypothetical protein
MIMKRLLKEIISTFTTDSVGYNTNYKIHNLIHEKGINGIDGEILKMLKSLQPSRKMYEIELYIDSYEGNSATNILGGADPDIFVINGRRVYLSNGKYFSERPPKDYLSEKYYHIKSFRIGNYILHLHFHMK